MRGLSFRLSDFEKITLSSVYFRLYVIVKSAILSATMAVTASACFESRPSCRFYVSIDCCPCLHRNFPSRSDLTSSATGTYSVADYSHGRPPSWEFNAGLFRVANSVHNRADYLFSSCPPIVSQFYCVCSLLGSLIIWVRECCRILFEFFSI